ncbi:uncharacterized protein LOC106766436 isoform X1 [Vigna radiata var. radiata]|uniref:Uncharacterized protein LOC106766436 isoform X1 n=1 Tax=Vigna radiata var. radiata TaxID=3916 RepID=A0A3Q0F9X0_VIGRR|nr:uncharacterized protein LOC106766436 isoform X1 [Vigna radiata var. radiata]
MRKYSVQALLLTFASFLLLILLSPSIPQPQLYHHFADNRNFFGIPNAPNVISNFPFMVIGLIGLVLCHRRSYFNISLEGELWGWKCFYAGVTSVAFGSSYYHLHPDDASLLWDRIPFHNFDSSILVWLLEMTVAFASLLAILIIERIDAKKGTHAIVPLIMIGIIINVYWRFFDDIRLYILAQSAACIAIPLMATLLPPMYTHSPYWLWASGFYLLAMLQETTDRVIYAFTFHIVSGHTLKHLSAAMVPAILSLMLAKRSVYSDKLLHAKST